MLNRIIYILFFTVSFLEISGEYFNIGLMVYFTKPLLIPILMVYVIYNIDYTSKKSKVQLLAALFFATLGDIFLMFTHKSELFFFIGLCMFLITHILYILFFISHKPNRIVIYKSVLYVLLIALYYFFLMALINDRLSHYAIPVYIYGLVLCIMIYSVFIAGFKRQKPLIVVGAILFVLSDSLIAISKFLINESNELIHSSIMIMYVLGQLLIVLGATKYLRKGRI